MSSRKIEDIHTNLLKKLLSDSGLVCTRSNAETPLEESLPEDIEEEVEPETEAVHEGIIERFEEHAAVEAEQEIVPTVFPSPSLRRVLPDRIRKIEESNRIHVLPDFNTEIDPADIPRIANTAPQKYIDILADLIGCEDYKNSLAEYWVLDTLANLLRRAQEDGMDRQTQKILILWFLEWMKEMEYFDAADRKRMLKRFEDNMIEVAIYMAEENMALPTPLEAGVSYTEAVIIPEMKSGVEATSDVTSKKSFVSRKSSRKMPSEGQGQAVSFSSAWDCLMHDLTKIIHYIYDLFSTDFQYDLIRSIFTFSPGYVHIDAPYQLQNPKRLYMAIKGGKPKKEKSPKDKTAKGKGKKGDVEPTEEYLALMALKAYDDRIREEQEMKDHEEWTKKSHILPLTFAATDEIFDKYWPPPPPPPDLSEFVLAGEASKQLKKGKK